MGKIYGEMVARRIAAHDVSPESKNNHDGGYSVPSEFVIECLEANELGDGMLYAALNADRYCFVKDISEWYVWRDHYWESDKYDIAIGAVETVSMRYAAEIEEIGKKLSAAMADTGDAGKDEQGRLGKLIGKLHKRIDRLRSSRGRENCLKFAHTNPVNSIAVVSDDFDKNPWLLACENGVINLKTGELKPGRQKDYISKHCPVKWAGIDADAGPWDEVLNQIYNNNTEMIDFIQRQYGYGITGLVVEHNFVVHYGGGRNGKDLMIEMISSALGDYAGPIPADMLLGDKFGSSANQTDPALLALKGRRLAIASETDEGRRFSSAKVKWLTGGGILSARGLYSKKATDFHPSHLLVLLTNNKPEAPGTDSAFWSRCLLVHHKIKFVEDPKLPNERKINRMLAIELREYLPGILAWLVRGCIKWQQHGICPPDIITMATDEYQEDENYIAQFIDSCCDLGDDFAVTAKELYAVFWGWYKENVNKNERFIPSRKKFGSKLMSTELFNKKRSGGMIKYYGIRLNADSINRIMSDGDNM